MKRKPARADLLATLQDLLNAIEMATDEELADAVSRARSVIKEATKP